MLGQIVAAAELEGGDRVLEVGPGRGALTERLLASPASAVLAVELDRRTGKARVVRAQEKGQQREGQGGVEGGR